MLGRTDVSILSVVTLALIFELYVRQKTVIVPQTAFFWAPSTPVFLLPHPFQLLPWTSVSSRHIYQDSLIRLAVFQISSDHTHAIRTTIPALRSAHVSTQH